MSLEVMRHPSEPFMVVQPALNVGTSEIAWTKQLNTAISAHSKQFEVAGLIPILMLSDAKVGSAREAALDKCGPEILGRFFEYQLGDKSKTEYGNELKIERKQDGTVSISSSCLNTLTFNPKTKTLLDEEGYPSNYRIEAGNDGAIILERGSQRLRIERDGTMSETRDLGIETCYTESPSHGKWQRMTYTPQNGVGWVATFHHNIEGPIELPDGSKATFEKDTVKMTRDGKETTHKFSEAMPLEFTAKDGTKCYVASHPAASGPVIYEIRQSKR